MPRTVHLGRFDYIGWVGARARSAAKGTASKRERKRKRRKESPIVVLNLALNCLHLINRVVDNNDGSIVAAKDRHDHRVNHGGRS